MARIGHSSKFIFLAGILWGLLAVGALIPEEAQASSKAYVTDSFEITVRAGKGTDYRVIRMLRTGDQVEVLEEDQGWSRVRLAGGAEGWVLTRFLVPEEPSSLRVERLAEQNQELRSKVGKLSGENARLVKENQALKNSVERLKADWDGAKKELEQLKLHSQDFLALQKKHQKLKTQYRDLLDRYNRLQVEYKERSDRHLWMLFGVGILVFGMIVGALCRRSSSFRGRGLLR